METIKQSSWQIRCASGEHMQQFGAVLGAALPPGSVLGLVGQLGAGKTTLVQGLARGMRVSDPDQVVSPTYTLVNEHTGATASLVHIDFYRLADAHAAEPLGIGEQLWRGDAVVAVEWADHLPTLMPPHTIWLHVVSQSDGSRLCSVRGMAQPAACSP